MKKFIYPDYYLGYNSISARAQTYVRKQDPTGVFRLIPVIQKTTFSKSKDEDVKRWEFELIEFIKRFNTDCYKVLMFYKFNDNLINPEHPWIKFDDIDENQESEHRRLIPYYYAHKKLNKNIKIV